MQGGDCLPAPSLLETFLGLVRHSRRQSWATRQPCRPPADCLAEPGMAVIDKATQHLTGGLLTMTSWSQTLEGNAGTDRRLGGSRRKAEISSGSKLFICRTCHLWPN